MRILFIITVDLESPAGLGRYLPWAKQLVCDGHEVHVAALHRNMDETTQRHFVQDGIHIHYAGQMHVRKDGDTTLYFSPPRLLWTVLRGALGLSIQALKVDPDLVHVGKPHPQNVFAGLMAARLLGRKLLFLDYDDLEAESNRTSGAWQRRALAWLERWFPRRCDGVTTHARSLVTHLLAAGVPAERILRVPSALDAARFAQPDPVQVSQWRGEIGLDPDQPVVIYVGSVSLSNHPVDLLLRAFALIVHDLPQAHLVLVGGGPDLAAMQTLARRLGIADQCTFLGRLPSQHIPALFSLATVSVDPVHGDAVAAARWPLKIAESLALDTPVVTGDVGDRAEMLGGAGLLVVPGDAPALADGVRQILGDPTLAHALRSQCSVAMTRYDAVTIGRQLSLFYAQMDGL